MPRRENKPLRKVDPQKRQTTHGIGETYGRRRPNPPYRAGHDTRINAFVNSLGRRSQAKRDAR